MEKIKEILKDRLVVLLFIILILGSMMIFMLIVSSNKYEDELSKLKLENKKLEYNNHELINSVETLKSEKETECNCGFYEDFYYQYADEVGAYE